MRTFDYVRPADADEASARLRNGARAMGGGTDVLTQLDRGILPADEVVDLRTLGLSGIAHDDGDGVRIGATTSVAEVERDPGIGERFAGLREAAAAVGSPQLREMGTVGGNLCQQVRCWYFRHPDLQCWLRGGDTCYAQIGDHRKHGLEPGDCISVAPSDLAAALLVLDAQVETSTRRMPLAALYRKASAEQRSTLTLEPGEFVAAVEVPRAPDASAYVIAGERAAWSFALVGVAAARFGADVRMAAIGVSNLPRPIDPDDPAAGLPGLEMTRWKRRLLETLASDAGAAVGR